MIVDSDQRRVLTFPLYFASLCFLARTVFHSSSSSDKIDGSLDPLEEPQVLPNSLATERTHPSRELIRMLLESKISLRCCIRPRRSLSDKFLNLLNFAPGLLSSGGDNASLDLDSDLGVTLVKSISSSAGPCPGKGVPASQDMSIVERGRDRAVGTLVGAQETKMVPRGTAEQYAQLRNKLENLSI